MALDTEIGGESSDSYATEAEGDAYFSIRSGAIKTAWDAASSADKENALKLAAQEMECFRYHGSKAFSEQKLKFPRNYHVDSEGYVIMEDCVKFAQIEQAGFTIANAAGTGEIDADSLQEMRALGITSVSAGRTSISFGDIPANKDGRLLELIEYGFGVKAAKLLSRYISKSGTMADGIESLIRITELRRTARFNPDVVFDEGDYFE